MIKARRLEDLKYIPEGCEHTIFELMDAVLQDTILILHNTKYFRDNFIVNRLIRGFTTSISEYDLLIPNKKLYTTLNTLSLLESIIIGSKDDKKALYEEIYYSLKVNIRNNKELSKRLGDILKMTSEDGDKRITPVIQINFNRVHRYINESYHVSSINLGYYESNICKVSDLAVDIAVDITNNIFEQSKAYDSIIKQ